MLQPKQRILQFKTGLFFSERQRQYSGVFRADGVYTPQMVVDGKTQLVGSDSQKALRAIAEAAKAQKTVVGEFHCGARSNYVLPYDRRIPLEIIIPRGQERPAEGREAAGRNRQFGGESGGDAEGRGPKPRAGAPASARELEGMIVDAEITSFPSPGAPPRGRVIEILGRREDFGVLSASGARKRSFGALAGVLAAPFGRVGRPRLSLRRVGPRVLASGSAPVGEFMVLEATRGRLRYTVLFTLDRFNRFSIPLKSVLGTHGLRVRVYQYSAGRNYAAQRSI